MRKLGLVEFTCGDRAEVAQQPSRIDSVRRWVGADAVVLGDDTREVLRLLKNLDGNPLRHILGDRHRLERRAVPARRGIVRTGSRLATQQQPRPDGGDGLAHHVRDLGQQVVLLCRGELAKNGAVHADHPAGPVRHQRASHRIHDQPPRRFNHNFSQRLLGGPGLIGLAAQHLDVPQPCEEGEEQREHQHLNDDEPKPGLVRRRADQDGCHHTAICGGMMRS